MQTIGTPRRAWPVVLLWSLAAGWALPTRPSRAQSTASGSRALVAYFSRTGNTRVVARQISRARQANLFEIHPADPYPEDYEETVEQARQERDVGRRPLLRETVPDMAAFDTVFLGMPVWNGTAPPVIRSFLSAHDFSGKILVPFITHGGYGAGQSTQVVRTHAPRASVLEGFVMEADQERRTLETVTRWLGRVPSGR